MPKKVVGREQTRQDILDIMKRVEEDFPDWLISQQHTHVSADWIRIHCRAYMKDMLEEDVVVEAVVYNTPRSPSLLTDMWKCYVQLWNQLERKQSGLTPFPTS